MKNLKRILCLALCLMMMLACVPAMAAGSVKIGVLVSDATSSEALAFRAYYTEYIANAYDVEFIYSDELTDAAGEKSAIDNFIFNNCKAVISFSSSALKCSNSVRGFPLEFILIYSSSVSPISFIGRK